MIRQAIIVVLTPAVVGTGVMYATSLNPEGTHSYTDDQQFVAHFAWEEEFRHTSGRVYAAAISGWLSWSNSGMFRPPAQHQDRIGAGGLLNSIVFA